MRALVAEDNFVFRRMLQNLLPRWGYEPVVCHNGMDAWEALQREDAPQLAILDWMMPGMDGAEVCRKLRKARKGAYVYVLLLTAKTETKDLVEGMDAGADDYITKPFHAHELRVRLRAGRRILELQSELLTTREALRVQATHDGLTGIWNRNAIFEILAKELDRSRREMSPAAVLMADLDRFKQINDVHGHAAGDAVLREAARRMKAAIRPYDALGRYGGEEFLLVLPGCTGDTAIGRAEELRRAFNSVPFAIPGDQIRVTCSLGLACTSDGDARSPDAMLRDADAALYQAKRNGRDRVEMMSVAAHLFGGELVNAS